MAASSEAGVLECPAIKEKKPKSASASKRKAREGSRKRLPADPNAQGRRNQALGARGEEAAARFLERNGYTILERNWTCFAGEADIIAVSDEALVFVEVKTRRNADKGLRRVFTSTNTSASSLTAMMSASPAKQVQLRSRMV